MSVDITSYECKDTLIEKNVEVLKLLLTGCDKRQLVRLEPSLPNMTLFEHEKRIIKNPPSGHNDGRISLHRSA